MQNSELVRLLRHWFKSGEASVFLSSPIPENPPAQLVHGNRHYRVRWASCTLERSFSARCVPDVCPIVYLGTAVPLRNLIQPSRWRMNDSWPMFAYSFGRVGNGRSLEREPESCSLALEVWPSGDGVTFLVKITVMGPPARSSRRSQPFCWIFILSCTSIILSRHGERGNLSLHREP